jgi:hypothetical protein
MKFAKFIFALLAICLGAMITGCTSKTEEDTAIPWNRPASWEGGIPGMGSPDQDGPH